MKVRFYILVLAIALFLAQLSQAALITGTVYDTNLEPIKAVVSINTTPKQTQVAENGSFEFQVPVGTFNLTATAGNQSFSQPITVVSDGVFRSDLILFGFDEPTLELPNVTDEAGLNQSEIGNGGSPGSGTTARQSPPNAQPWGLYAGIIVALAILAFIAYNYRKISAEAKALSTQTAAAKTAPRSTPRPRALPARPSEKNLNDFQKQIIAELRNSEGRMNQKDLRKLLPWSEAKVSIELDLLEEQGLIKKIRKGRGNIVILSEKHG